MSTLKQLRDQLVLENQSIVGDPYVGATMLNKWINDAQKFVQLQLSGLGMKKWETPKIFTYPGTMGLGSIGGIAFKTIDINSTNFPDIIEDVKAIRYISLTHTRGLNTYYGMAREISEENIEDCDNSYMKPTIKSSGFIRTSAKIYIAPDSATAATVHYTRVVTNLTEEDDNTEIPQEYEEFIIKRAKLSIDFYLKKFVDDGLLVQSLAKEIQEKYQLSIMKNIETKRKAKEGQTQE